METIKIIGLTILAAIIYGIVHDQITARVCLEYFTVFHPDIFHTDSPTLLGLGWGVWATWWVGAGLGVPLALCARAGRWPKRTARSLIQPLIGMMATTGLFATLTGITGYLMGRNGTVTMNPDLAQWIPPEHRAAFLGDWFALMTSYVVGFICGIVLCISTARVRRLAARREKGL